MRLIHTSDWHLGQTLLGHDRSAEHQAFLDWLLNHLQSAQIDALLIAGDIFDQANPSADAQRLYYHFLGQARLRCPHLSIVVIAGNHDSPGRIDAPHPILQALGVHVVGHYRGHDNASERAPIALPRRDGSIGAWVLAVPFLRPADLPKASVNAYLDGVAQTYRHAVESARSQRQDGQALIAMGHLHLRGAKVSEFSERKLLIGGDESLDAAIFPPDLAYVALGHLHLAQSVGAAHIRYCGSPLPLSFAELDYPHQVVELLLDGERLQSATAVAVPRAAQLLRIPAEHAPLEQVLEALHALIPTPSDNPELWPIIEIRVAMVHADTSMRGRIEQALQGKKVRFGRIDPLWPQRSTNAAVDPAPMSLTGLQPQLLFDRLVEQDTGKPADAELNRAFAELLAEAEADSG